MEKYGVEIDKRKIVEKEKRGKSGIRPVIPNDPAVNVPIDPDLGTEPFEKEIDDGKDR